MAIPLMPTNIAAPDTPAGQYSYSFNNPHYLNTTDVNGENWRLNTPVWMSVPGINQSVGLGIAAPQYQAQLDHATRAQGIADRGAYQQVAAQTYDQLRANQNSALDMMRQQQAAAIMGGAARGVAAAANAQAVLGMNAQNVALMTQLRQQQAQTYLDENARMAQNVAKAVEYTEQNRQYLGNLVLNRYDIDWKGMIGAGEAASAIIAAREAAAAERYSADIQLQIANIQAAAMRAGGGGNNNPGNGAWYYRYDEDGFIHETDAWGNSLGRIKDGMGYAHSNDTSLNSEALQGGTLIKGLLPQQPRRTTP